MSTGISDPTLLTCGICGSKRGMQDRPHTLPECVEELRQTNTRLASELAETKALLNCDHYRVIAEQAAENTRLKEELAVAAKARDGWNAEATEWRRKCLDERDANTRQREAFAAMVESVAEHFDWQASEDEKSAVASRRDDVLRERYDAAAKAMTYAALYLRGKQRAAASDKRALRNLDGEPKSPLTEQLAVEGRCQVCGAKGNEPCTTLVEQRPLKTRHEGRP